MSSILKTISLIVFLSLVFVFNECKHRLKHFMIFTNISFISVESQPQPHQMDYWIPRYPEYKQYGINTENCGLVNKPIDYGTDRNDHNYCKIDENTRPERRIDPGNYRRYHPYRRPPDDPYGPSTSKGTQGRIYPPIEVIEGESPYTLLFFAKVPEKDRWRLRREANSRYYEDPEAKNETICVPIKVNPDVNPNPGTVQTKDTKQWNITCTASLIAPYWVLLAAHCQKYMLQY